MAKTIAAYGGGFKPPTAGHFEVVSRALSKLPNIDEFIIYVGGGERDGITQAEAVLIWEIYQTYLPMKVKIEPSKAPIGDIIRLGKNNPQDTVYFVIGAREKNEGDLKDIESRTKGVEEKYPNMKVEIISTPGGSMSGTNARRAAKVSPEEFYRYLPTQLKDTEKEEVYNIVKPMVNEALLPSISDIKSKLKDLITAIKQQGGDAKKAFLMLVKAAKGEINLSSDDKAFIKLQLKDALKSIGFTAIFALPAGSLVLMLMKALKISQYITPTSFLNENASYSSDIDYKAHIKELTKYMIKDGWNIQPLPKVVFKHGDSENARDFFGKTAYYDPNTQTIVLYTEGRHPKDIVRSFSHEMVHHEQNLEGRLDNIYTTNTQEDDKLNDIEKEANLNGTMTFRNWTDSLQEKKKTKDPFGINAYALELARGLEEELDEDRKKKKDPKKGTGKKPEGSGRRLYTDEDPKDTVGVSFRTKEDIVDTLNKKSFKAKSHARQSQIINLIHQRVRAAYGRAKDPETKARLKRGLDYIEKRKEASKAKTKRLQAQKENVAPNHNGKAAPFGSGYKKIDEGRYDSISRQLASIALNAWKSDFKDGASYGYFMGEITPEEYPTDLTFTFKALGRFVDGGYKHNGYSRSDGEVGVKYEIPKDAIPQIWEEVYMDLISTIRHEIEHQTQGGKNVKPGKGMASDQELRKLIRKGGSDLVAYVTLPKEIESNVQGLYLKAKKWRRPYEEIVDEYIKDFLKITNPADVNYVKSKWQEVAKKRSLPDLLNEGVYDSIVSKLAKNVLNTWKGQFDENPKRLFSLLNTSYELEDAKGRPLDFEFIAKLDFKKTKDRNYKVDGGANEGDDETDGFIALNFQVDPRELPRMWSTIAMDIRDVLRHEIEHLTQGGWNERSGKYMEDDSQIRDLIQKYKLLAPKNYFMLDKEVDAMLQGMYFKAKKSRTPFADVIDDYLDKVGLEPEEKEEIKTRWRGRIKALSLPLFEELEEMEYEIYSDMDGVLTDFDAQFMAASDGIRPSEYERNMGKDKFWELIDGRGVGFWVGMPWMPDGKQYWDYIKEYNPILLSSPSRSETSRLGKRLWVRNQLPGTKLILAQAKDKQNYARKNRILIDDRPSNIEEWRSQGGVGILHTSASNTIRQLKELGL